MSIFGGLDSDGRFFATWWAMVFAFVLLLAVTIAVPVSLDSARNDKVELACIKAGGHWEYVSNGWLSCNGAEPDLQVKP